MHHICAYGLWSMEISVLREPFFSRSSVSLCSLGAVLSECVRRSLYKSILYRESRARAGPRSLARHTHARERPAIERRERAETSDERPTLRERESLAHVSVPLTCVYLSGPCLSLRAHPRTPARVLSVPSVGPAGGAPELTRRPRIGTLPVPLCGRCPQLCSPWGSSSYRVMSNTLCI